MLETVTIENQEKMDLFVLESGKLLYDEYGESFGYEEQPSFLKMPVNQIEICRSWITEKDKRGIVYFRKPQKNQE
jgi:hypothetical protein